MLFDRTIVGEAYMNYYSPHIGRSWYEWNKFTQDDIKDEYQGNLKIKGKWVDKSRVILYDSIYDLKRKKIEKAVDG